MRSAGIKKVTQSHFFISLSVLIVLLIPFFVFFEIIQNQKSTHEKIKIWNEELTTALIEKKWVIVQKIIRTIYDSKMNWIALSDMDNNTFSYPYEVGLNDCMLSKSYDITHYNVKVGEMKTCYNSMSYLKYSLIKNPFAYCLLVILFIIAFYTYYSFFKYRRKIIDFIKSIESDFINKQTNNPFLKDELLENLYDLVFFNLEMKLKEKEMEDRVITVNRLSKLTHDLVHNLKSPLSILVDKKTVFKELPQEENQPIQNAIDDIVLLSDNMLTADRKRLSESYKICYEQVVPCILSSINMKKTEYMINKNINFKIFVEKNTEALFCKICTPEFKAVLSNLVNNSVDAAGNNTCKIIVTASVHDKYLKITIADNGKGMSPDLLSKILHEKHTTKPKGNGIGISHAREQINLWNGKLEIKSDIGIGTKVSLLFPILKEAILIEDKKIIQANWKHHADKSNIKLNVFSSFTEFDLSADRFNKEIDIFLDLGIPNEMKGEDFAEHLYKQKGFKNIWFQTGRTIDEIKPLPFIKGIVIGKIPPWKI